MSIYLRVTEESSTKMGILRFSILILFIYFFSNFLHINWCSNSGLLDFRCGGPKKRIAVSLLPGVSPGRWGNPPTRGKFPCKPSNRPSMLAMAWVDMLESDLFGRCFHCLFFGGCDRCFTVKYLKSIVDTQSDIRSTWRREHLPKDASRSDDWFNFCQMSDECEFCNNSEDVSSSSSEIKEIFHIASIAMWWFFRRGQKWSNALSLGKQIIFFLIPHPKIPPKKSAHIRDPPSDAYMVSIFQILHAFAPVPVKKTQKLLQGETRTYRENPTIDKSGSQRIGSGFWGICCCSRGQFLLWGWA